MTLCTALLAMKNDQRRFATQNIDAMRDWLDMQRVDAARFATKVIQFQTIRNGAVVVLPGDCVSWTRLPATNIDSRVVSRPCAVIDPAAVRHEDHVPHRSLKGRAT